MTKKIRYPYLPNGRGILYVSRDNEFIIVAREYARDNSLDKEMSSGAVLVKDGKIVGIGANGSDYHNKNNCRRIELGYKTGEGYELCEGCHPKNHSERTAIVNAADEGSEISNADLYLWGHWWCCEPCWEIIIQVGIRDVYLLKGSERLFNKEHSENIIGKQFD